jgi:3-phenylpropionate/trans-cinnamate dioxygenase ferredoxin reductase subunit
LAVASWRKLCDLEDLADGIPSARKIGKKQFLVVRRKAEASVCGNKCPHYGAPLSDGIVRDGEITCPWHNARFDLERGRMVSPPALDDIPRYESRVENGEVLVARALASWEGTGRGSDDRVFVVVGAGAAGAAAVENLRREGFAGRIVLVSAEEALPYDRPDLSKGFITGESDPAWLTLRSKEFYEKLEIEIRLGTRAIALDPRGKRLVLEDGTELVYDRLLLATGGQARRLNIPGSDLQGVHILRSKADAEALAADIREGARAVAIGAGFIGLEVASSLRTRGLDVTVVAPEQVPLAQMAGSEYGRRVQALHEAKGAHFRLGRTITAIEGDPRAQRVILSDGTELEADLVLMGVGIDPAVAWLGESGLLAGGGVLVDENLETRAPGVFAAGDIAVVPGSSEGPMRIEHWTVAERQGRHAALGMIGQKSPFREVPFFWSTQCDSSLKHVGWPFREGDECVFRGDPQGDSFMAGHFRRGRLVGAAAINVSWDIIALEVLLREGAEVSRDQLADPGVDLLTMARAKSGEE